MTGSLPTRLALALAGLLSHRVWFSIGSVQRGPVRQRLSLIVLRDNLAICPVKWAGGSFTKRILLGCINNLMRALRQVKAKQTGVLKM